MGDIVNNLKINRLSGIRSIKTKISSGYKNFDQDGNTNLRNVLKIGSK